MSELDGHPERGGIEVRRGRIVPWSELSFRTARSGGPGGQHANKVETQVELYWDLESSGTFSPAEKARLREGLATRLGRGGSLRLRARAARSQAANRKAVVERFRLLLSAALKPRKSRRATLPTRASKEERLAAKRRRSRRKTDRRAPGRED